MQSYSKAAVTANSGNPVPTTGIDTAETIAAALSEHQRRKPARAKKKASKTRAPRRESTKTITTRLYRKWAEIVKALEGHKCAVCGEPDSKEHPLNAHHIMPRQNFSGLRFDPRNGISLCPKCHKFGRFSAHKGGIWFAWWLEQHRTPLYKFCTNNARYDIDCGDRKVLYGIEEWLHGTYSRESIGTLSTYSVRFVLKGEKREASFVVDNPKAAEFMCQNDYGRGVKIIRTELVK